jgi:hypothetical protein
MSRYVKCINNKQFIRFKGEPPPDAPIYGLEVGQVYKLAPPEPNDGDMLRVIDGSGEDYLYPASYFEPLIIPQNGHVAKTLTAHVPEWLYGVLHAEAIAANKSMSALLREWLTQHLDLPA